ELTGSLLLRQLANRNARPVSQDLSNVVVGALCNFFQVTRTPLLFLRGTLFVQLPLSVTQPGCLLEVLRINRSFLFLADFCDAIVYIANALRRSHALNTHAGTCLIQQVNCLIWQEAIVDVTV